MTSNDGGRALHLPGTTTRTGSGPACPAGARLVASVTARPDVGLASRIVEARRIAAPGSFVSITLPAEFDPRCLLDDPQRNGVVASYERPDRRLALVGVGVAGRADVPAGAHPTAAKARASALLAGPVGGDVPLLAPRLLGGFRFNPASSARAPWQDFGAGWLVLPRLLFVLNGESNAVVVAPGADADAAEALVGGAASPSASAPLRLERPMDREAWLASVSAIAREVRAGKYEKAVLASTQQLASDAPISIGRALARLRAGYPDCHVFTMTQGGTTFLGASPELLVSLMDGRVRALGLAGSARRGDTPEEDERIGAALLASGKDRIEHEAVVRAIRERLGPLTEDLVAPNQPELRRLRNIQHLSTEIGARVRPGTGLLDLVQRLHPTPAVCGWPADRARAVIAEHEAFDRGWYAGPVGWMDAAGDGEFAVALRSAVVSGERAWLFAGNGIMGDSVPEAELAEVQLKFRPLSEALGA
ncbi:MAG: isochorismate synthase [Dehalococcoidia bacterium]|nr:MAG: isochorismate synthase [Dehalococcoidia bacterium]